VATVTERSVHVNGIDLQLADLSRPGALVAGLNWYRANIDPVAFVAPDPARFSLPAVACPTMGVWSSDDFALTEAQMTLPGGTSPAPGATNTSKRSTTGSRSTPPTASTGCCWSSWGQPDPGLAGC
jgi:hypothetical protein